MFICTLCAKNTYAENRRRKKEKKLLTSSLAYAKIRYVLTRERQYADVAELADALDSGSSGGNSIWVQVPSSAPNQYNPNQFFPVGDGFGLFVYFERYENTYFPNGVIKRPESKPRGSRKKKADK